MFTASLPVAAAAVPSRLAGVVGCGGKGEDEICSGKHSGIAVGISLSTG